jgi:hypothetical protein
VYVTIWCNTVYNTVCSMVQCSAVLWSLYHYCIQRNCGVKYIVGSIQSSCRRVQRGQVLYHVRTWVRALCCLTCVGDPARLMSPSIPLRHSLQSPFLYNLLSPSQFTTSFHLCLQMEVPNWMSTQSLGSS